jgi:DHA2 family multidrug resistance protein-like MFS transporter
MLEHFWWGSVFLLGVPVMLLLLAVGPSLLPEFRDPNAGRLDLTSASLSLVGVLAVIFGLKRVAEHGLEPVAALSILLGVGSGLLFVRRQRKLADPLIDLRLFHAPVFSTALTVNILGIFAAMGAFLLIHQYLQLVLGLSPMRAGLWTIPSSFGFIAGSMLAPVLARRARHTQVMAGGLVLAALGFVLLAGVDESGGLAFIVTGSILMALGLAPVITLTTDVIVGSAPPERAGAASAISETGAELGGALGIAILGSIGTAVYRREVLDGIPAGVPVHAAEVARGTLGGAVAAAEQLPPHVGSALLDTAREAFVDALQVSSAISAAIVLVLAAMVVMILRRSRPDAIANGQSEAASAAAA